MKENTPQTRYEKMVRRRGILLLVSALALGFICQILGIISAPRFGPDFPVICKQIWRICCLLVIAILPFQMLMSKRFINRLNKMNVMEQQQYILKHREHAEQISSEKKVFVKKCRRLAKMCSVLYFVLGILIGFVSGVNYNVSSNTVFTFISGLLILAAFSRIQFPLPQVAFEEDETLLSKEEYPEIYGLARKAAKTLHCEGEIKIFLNNDFNAGIARIEDIYSIQLGVVLLNLLSKEELYTILLHEFAHMNSERYIQKEFAYNDFVAAGGNPHFLSGLVSVFYSYVDVMYAFHFALYQYASSLLSETEADKVMAEYADANYAASALLKSRYHDLYEWEGMICDKKNLFEASAMSQTMIEDEIKETKEAFSSRSEVWNQLVQSEIISRSASHPTTKMRMEAMGVTEFAIVESQDALFQAECEKAASFISKLLYEKNLKNYEENRKTYYLEPLEKVSRWEESGKPIIPEEYADILNALRSLGRIDDVMKLCDEAIEKLDSAASNYAHFTKGSFLLYRYDPAGLKHVYEAMENNSNFVEEGLSLIGNFCCLTGNQIELDNYRQKAVILAQKHKDMYSELSILRPVDQLVPEELPKELFENILGYIGSIEDNSIQNVYLVRKIISEDFFTSVFIIRFQKDTPYETIENVMQKIFFYLDTRSDWQFSLFEYSEVENVKFKKIKNACVYSKKE